MASIHSDGDDKGATIINLAGSSPDEQPNSGPTFQQPNHFHRKHGHNPWTVSSPINTYQKVSQNNSIDLNEPWNLMIKRYLKRIGEQSQGYHWAHEQEKIYYEQLEKWLNITDIVLLAVVGSLNTSNVLTLASNQQAIILNEILSVTLLILNIIQAIVLGILQFGNFQQRVFDHKYNSVKFNEIYNDILSQFSLPIDKREKDDDYMRNKTREFNDLLTTAPAIRMATFKRYEKATQKENIFKPIVIGGFDKIEIVVDVPSDTTSPTTSKLACQQIKHNLDDKINIELQRFLDNT